MNFTNLLKSTIVLTLAFICSTGFFTANAQSPWVQDGTKLTYNEGRVGIGTTGTWARLHVANNGNEKPFVVQQIGGYTQPAAFITTTNNGILLQSTNYGNPGRYDFFLRHKIAGVWKTYFRVSANGKVQIGTEETLDDYLMTIGGKVMAEGLKVQLEGEWSDYVFENDYERNSLAEIESYVQANKHLPNVPSAKEIGADGINVAEMDATLLRQIEELWLHVIDLNKEKEALEARLQNLESK